MGDDTLRYTESLFKSNMTTSLLSRNCADAGVTIELKQWAIQQIED